jgi:cytochrome c556
MQLTVRIPRRAIAIGLGVAALTLMIVPLARAGDHEHGALPEGPISERHELMEQIGSNAKAINDAKKAGDATAIAKPAQAIAEASSRIAPLFPKGSTDPASRAKPEIWEQFPEFQALATDLGAAASALARTASEGGDVSDDAKVLMMTCKKCHDMFRKPKEQ